MTARRTTWIGELALAAVGAPVSCARSGFGHQETNGTSVWAILSFTRTVLVVRANDGSCRLALSSWCTYRSTLSSICSMRRKEQVGGLVSGGVLKKFGAGFRR